FTPLMAPNVNSYRRLRFGASKPFNVGWGYDNRIAGLRVPDAPPQNRRVENRLPGSDTNPYLAIAATLAAGYLGMTQELEPSSPVEGEETGAFETLPLDLRTALVQFESSDEASATFGENFVKGFTEVVRAEYDAYLRVVSSWERKFLLLAV
ncbi:MAG: glutamine synthetase, partial [Rhodospirillales bacterium]|nr:glutamine synthetase [Rhodospirillales bacterium]